MRGTSMITSMGMRTTRTGGPYIHLRIHALIQKRTFLFPDPASRVDRNQQGPEERGPSSRPQRARAKNSVPLPPTLNRPIGVASIGPTETEAEAEALRGLSLRERMLFKLNKERLDKQRAGLMKEFRTSYWRDFHDMSQWYGKQWIAPARVFKKAKALLMPTFRGRTLLSSDYSQSTSAAIAQRDVSIVIVSNVRASEDQMQTFCLKLFQKYGTPDQSTFPSACMQIIRLNIQQNPLKALLTKAFLRSIRKNTPQSEWDKYFLITSPPDAQTMESVAIINHLVGYIYVVDRDHHIRWAGCAQAMEKEADALVNAVDFILTEAKRRDTSAHQNDAEVKQAEEAHQAGDIQPSLAAEA